MDSELSRYYSSFTNRLGLSKEKNDELVNQMKTEEPELKLLLCQSNQAYKHTKEKCQL